MLKLPELLEIPQDIESIIPSLFEVFKTDFIDSPVYFLSDPVVIPRPKNEDDYPDVFWHIITKQENPKGRLFDFERAKRLVWLRPMIEGFREPEILKWRSLEFDKNSGKVVQKYYLWYKNGQYLTVLKHVCRNGSRYYIATAFYVFRSNEQHFLNQYNAGEKFPWT